MPFSLLSRFCRILLIIGVCWGGLNVQSAEIDPQRPAESLFRIYAEAEQIGWTPLHHLQAGNMAHLERAVVHWQMAMTQDVITLQRLSQTLIDFNRWTDAVDVMRDWLTFIPYDSYPNQQLGLLLVARDPLQALYHLQTSQPNARDNALIAVLEQSADDADLPILIGEILFEQGRFAYAEYAFKHGAMWNIDPAIAWAYTALSRQAQGKDGDAWMQSALDHAPDDATVHYLHGFYLRNDARLVESREAFGRAVALDLLNPLYYAELGNAYQYIGDLTTARYWLEYAVVLSENDPIYVNRLNQFDIQEQREINRISGQ
jgi:tetratricopeptide (TPR) repeat protein